MRIDYFGKSDKGRVRKTNEDHFAIEKINPDEYLFVVADGMGGHRAGDVASKLGTLSFLKHYKKCRKKKYAIFNSMNRALLKANTAILDKADADPEKRGMGTTFSAMVISDSKAHMVHVGDSRIYLVRNDTIEQVTTDHTFVGKMVEEGRLSEEEAREHPQKNILYMSLGARKAFEPEIDMQLDLEENDILIICSDGLSNMVEDKVLKEYAVSYDPKKAVEELINLANDNGGQDNITLLITRVEPNREPDKTEPIPIIKKKPFSFIRKFIKKNTTEEP